MTVGLPLLAAALSLSGCAGFFFSTTSQTGLISSAAAATYGTSTVGVAMVTTSTLLLPSGIDSVTAVYDLRLEYEYSD